VAAFDREIHSMLDRLGMDVKILESPYGVPMTTAFPDDEEHASYDRDSVTRFWRIIDWSGGVFESVSGWFCGKTSPVQLYWHGFDLAFSHSMAREHRLGPRPTRSRKRRTRTR
jgi:hypothetical protein